MSDELSDFEDGQAEAIAVLALEGTLTPRDCLVLQNMFPRDVINNAASKMEGK